MNEIRKMTLGEWMAMCPNLPMDVQSVWRESYMKWAGLETPQPHADALALLRELNDALLPIPDALQARVDALLDRHELGASEDAILICWRRASR